MDFEELFDRFFTSQHELEDNLKDINKNNFYDDSFLEITKNEDKGTAFFNKFINNPLANISNPPFEVSPFKTFVLSDKPDLLR